MPQGPKGERRSRDVIGNAVHVMRIARVQSSRRLEREAGRKVEVMWLTGRVVPDHKTIAISARTTAALSARSAPCSRPPCGCLYEGHHRSRYGGFASTHNVAA
jgi:hypothetical protein